MPILLSLHSPADVDVVDEAIAKGLYGMRLFLEAIVLAALENILVYYVVACDICGRAVDFVVVLKELVVFGQAL